MNAFFKKTKSGIRFFIKITPKASQNKIQEWVKGSEGEWYLKIMITAIPEKGKANKALLKFLSKEWKIAQAKIAIIQGETDQLKLIDIQGDHDCLKNILEKYNDTNTYP